MKCPSCGTTSRIREKDKFCHNCGAKLHTDKEEWNQLDKRVAELEEKVRNQPHEIEKAVEAALNKRLQAIRKSLESPAKYPIDFLLPRDTQQ